MPTLEELLQRKQGIRGRKPITLDELVQNARQSNPLLAEQKPERVEEKEGGFFKSLFSETVGLGETLAAPFVSQQFIEVEEQRARFLNTLTERIKSGKTSSEEGFRLLKMMQEDVSDFPEVLEKSTKQVIGEVVGTALWITPFNEIKMLKGLGIMNRAARGAAVGGSFSLAHGLAEDEDTEQLFKRFVIGAALGAPMEMFAPIVFKGAGNLLMKSVALPFKIISKITPKPVKKVFGNTVYKFLAPVETRLRTLGSFGEEVADRFLASDRNSILRTGMAFNKMNKSGLWKINDQETFVLLDLLEGRLKRKDVSKKVADVFDTLDVLRKGVAEEAVKKKIKIQLRRGEKIPFQVRKDFFPHSVPSLKQLQPGKKYRKLVIANSVRVGKFNSTEEAELMLNSFLRVVEKEGRGARDEFWVNYLLRTGQAKTKDEAVGKTLRFWKPSRNSRFGHLERAREINFPFYDPDVRRQFPLYYAGAIQRLEKVAEFGVNGEKLTSLMGKLQRERVRVLGAEEGRSAAKESKVLIEAIFEVIKNTGDLKQKTSLFLRSVQIPKLAFAQILNLGQSLNTLLATDLPSLAHGLQIAFRKEGVEAALRSGATLDTILREAAQIPGDRSFGQIFLKLTGFTWTEKFNRTVAANSGIQYAQRLRNKLLKNPADEQAKRLLEELGIRTSNLAEDFTEKELLQVAQKMSFLTQFRSRPIDLPLFSASPEGKVVFQFKNFAYNQTRFVKNQLQKEWRAGDIGRFSRAVMILGILYPMTGEVIADVRSLITGSTRPTNFFDRYLENIFNTGAVGIWGDVINSLDFDRFLEFAAGPTATTVFETSQRMWSIGTSGKITDSDKRFFIRQPGITRPLANYLFPPKSKERQTILDFLLE